MQTTPGSSTEGPWHVRKNGLITAGPKGLHIAKVAQTGMGYAAHRNALLIAAAPALLSAVHDAMDECECTGAIGREQLTERLRAALLAAGFVR